MNGRELKNIRIKDCIHDEENCFATIIIAV
jgi:hypothetical protein